MPPPRVHQIRYAGFLAARSKIRVLVIPDRCEPERKVVQLSLLAPRQEPTPTSRPSSCNATSAHRTPKLQGMAWARLLRTVSTADSLIEGLTTVHRFGVLLSVIRSVVIGRRAAKQLRKVPARIAAKLRAWIDSIEMYGLEETRSSPGLHDEALLGTRKGQRSIRLSVHYRAIYEVKSAGTVEFVSVEEVSKHDY